MLQGQRVCEGTETKSVPSLVDKTEEQRKEGEHQEMIGAEEEKAGELTVEEKVGKTEVCLVEGEWAEQEVSIWEEDKSEKGVVWFSTVMEEYERKKREESWKAFERVRNQGLLRDFPNLKVGGLLPDPEHETEKPKRMVTHEWTVIVAPREAELRREWEKMTAPFPEGPDERGWVRHSCCGTIV